MVGCSSPHDLFRRYGGAGTDRPWAVITGDIGRGFAVEPSRRGFNLCLISRSMDRLGRARSVEAEGEGRSCCSTVPSGASTVTSRYFRRGPGMDRRAIRKLHLVVVGVRHPAFYGGPCAHKQRGAGVPRAARAAFRCICARLRWSGKLFGGFFFSLRNG